MAQRKKKLEIKDKNEIKIQDRVSKEKLEKYFKITGEALEIIKKSINKKRKNEAEKIIDMAERYYQDALFFKSKNDFITAFAALNYAHGWIDVGSKLGIFEVNDDRLFVLK